MNTRERLSICLFFLVPLVGLGGNAQAQFDPFITQPQTPPAINAPAMSIEQQMQQGNGSSTPRSIFKASPKFIRALQTCNNSYIRGYMASSLRNPNRYIHPQILNRARQCGAI